MITDNTHKINKEPSSPKNFTRTAALRQKTQNKMKDRIELVENYVGPTFGDSRKATKSQYTSKNSMLKEE